MTLRELEKKAESIDWKKKFSELISFIFKGIRFILSEIKKK